MGRHKRAKQKTRNSSRPFNNRDEEASGSTRNCESPLLYKVETSGILGRYLTASRDLTAGEVVMSDEAIVVGPCQESKAVCIGCYANLNLDDEKCYRRCVKCGWPLCSENCPGNQTLGHSREECSVMAKSSIKDEQVDTLKSCFYAIAPFRLLLLKLFNPGMWKVVQEMESHTEARKKNEKLWKLNEEFAVEKIRTIFGLSEFTADEIHFTCGVLEVNAFEVCMSPTAQPLRALYPNAFLFSHNCVPNTCHSNGANFCLVVRTTQVIPKNGILTVSYTYTLQSTLRRRRHLLDTKFFSCCCERCSDVTEFGTYSSAIKCPKCCSGFVLPRNPLEATSGWMCATPTCSGYSVDVEVIDKLSERWSDDLDAINGNDIKGYEDFLIRCNDVFHENHYLRLSALHCLFQLYGKVNGYLINELTNRQLERKIDICRTLLKIFAKFEPGLSKQRGVLLYELQAALMVALRRKFESENVTKKEIKQKLKEINKCLEESWKILSTEWEHCAEGQIAAAAKEALESMKNWESIIDMM